MQYPEVFNGLIVHGLSQALSEGKSGLSDVPKLMERVLKEGMWRDFVVDATRERVTYERFIDFVTTKPLEGLGADLKLIKRICADRADLLDLIDREVRGRQGERTDLVDNVNEVSRPTGNGRSNALRRLRKDRPDLHKKVINRELSPHAAMIKAGFRHQSVSVNWANAAATAEKIIRVGGPEFARELVAAMIKAVEPPKPKAEQGSTTTKASKQARKGRS